MRSVFEREITIAWLVDTQTYEDDMVYNTNKRRALFVGLALAAGWVGSAAQAASLHEYPLRTEAYADMTTGMNSDVTSAACDINCVHAQYGYSGSAGRMGMGASPFRPEGNPNSAP
ncbi:MAG: hypothetical protein KGL46_04755 [Hyphomicrobiales bacterium]|nr:hypothetical protein [Hyphomicrobiales bacterium]